MKFLLVANTGWYLHNFRRGLALRLQDEGADVVCVSPRDDYVDQLSGAGLRWVEWDVRRSGLNPLREQSAVRALVSIYRSERPDLVHHFTIKSILYGTTAARRAGVPRIVNSVTGLGHIFVSSRPVVRLIRPAIRRWYTRCIDGSDVCAMFQNADDLETLAPADSPLRNSAVLTRGSGVDLERFAPDESRASSGSSIVLFAGRLLAEKGIHEFVEAGGICQSKERDVVFRVCGNPDAGNPSSVDTETLDLWRQFDWLSLAGHVDPIDPELERADVVVLPSWREGTPRLLLEAAAMGKPLVACDVPGCREVVVDGENGLLVPPRDPEALAGAISRLLEDSGLRSRMGDAGRRMMVDEFDESEVINQTVRVYQDLHDRNATDAGGQTPRTKRGVFTFSLDFELAWGTRGRPRAAEAPPFLDGTRDAIRGMLGLFEQYGVSGTWATVGALLLGASQTSRHRWLAGSQFDDIPAGDAKSHPHWYADDVLEWLVDCKTPQDIGCHTLTHMFVDSSIESRDAFKREIDRFMELFESLYLERPRSFIFPKAYMAHLDLLADAGFTAYRGPENKWFESLPGERPSAAFRVVDARLGLAPVVQVPRQEDRQLWMIPSSQFYSPFLSVGRYVSVEARVRKAIKGLHRAAKIGGVFHLWTHPFNMGLRTDELLRGLDQILAEAARLRDAGQIDIQSMAQIADQLEASRVRFPAESVASPSHVAKPIAQSVERVP